MSFPRFSRLLNPFWILFLRLSDFFGWYRPPDAGQKPFTSLRRKGDFGTLNRGRKLILLFVIYLIELPAKYYPRTSLQLWRLQEANKDKKTASTEKFGFIGKLYVFSQGLMLFLRLGDIEGCYRPLEASQKPLICIKRTVDFCCLILSQEAHFIFELGAKHYLKTRLQLWRPPEAKKDLKTASTEKLGFTDKLYVFPQVIKVAQSGIRPS